MAQNRYIGSYPKIGIRPIIDGRRGPLKVRESLEDQTMNMAKSAAKLFEENLRYSNGEPVKVVIADTTIGRVAEAAACEAKFRREGVALEAALRYLQRRAVRYRERSDSALHRTRRVGHDECSALDHQLGGSGEVVRHSYT